MATKKTMLGAAAFAAALTGGAMAGALLGAPSLSWAQESDGTTTTAPDAACAEGRGQMRGPGGGHLDVAADVLGVSEDDLRAALQDGRSLADVAEEKGVEVQAVVDAIVADHAARIDEAVAEGDLDADRAAEVKANMVERVTAMVNGEMPMSGPGGPGGRGGPGHHGEGMGDGPHGAGMGRGMGSGPHWDDEAETEGASYGA